jgi:hypothetical protein
VDSGAIIAAIALGIGILSGLANWLRTSYLFKQREYPAVAWYTLACKPSPTGTTVTTKIVNKGPRDALDVSFAAYLCQGRRVEAWCQYSHDSIPSEGLDLVLTQELEEDLLERFGGLKCEKGWEFSGNPRSFKAKIELSYIPALHDAIHLRRIGYFELAPEVEGTRIVNWKVKSRSSWTGRFPYP